MYSMHVFLIHVREPMW